MENICVDTRRKWIKKQKLKKSETKRIIGATFIVNSVPLPIMIGEGGLKTTQVRVDMLQNYCFRIVQVQGDGWP